MKKFPLEGENEGKEAPLFVVPVSVKDRQQQACAQCRQPQLLLPPGHDAGVTLITGGTKVMANVGQIRKTVAQVLHCIEKVSSFASSINPIFGIVSSLVGVARKGLYDEEGHALDEGFQEINNKLESISQKNYLCLKKIRIDEVNETYGKYEERIKHQYSSFNDMVACVKRDPANSKRHMKRFKKIYEKDKGDLSLDEYYNGIMGNKLFGRALLQVYLDNCDGDREIMESHCSHIAHLLQMGLIALMAYTAVTEDDEDGMKEKWEGKMKKIQEKMQEILSQCKDKTS
ncbi:protein rapunzel-like [Takifugu flavidus]|uniref:protein rapunzel-like n=1 Tax=Takifugu flavidus TaxID=433684 RepID=UPI002544B597|nr:protein rapunzel-like [Takifugu flavidus]